MSLDLEGLIDEATRMVSEAGSLDSLESVRVELLGRKGRLTGVLKSVGALPAAEKPAAGQAVNQAKLIVQVLIDERRRILDDAALAERLAADRLDITLPGSAAPAGGLHPMTLTI